VGDWQDQGTSNKQRESKPLSTTGVLEKLRFRRDGLGREPLSAMHDSSMPHRSYRNPAYMCNECYVLRQGVNGCCAFTAASVCRRLMYDGVSWDTSTGVAAVRYGVRMMIYERLRPRLGDSLYAPFVAGAAGDACGQVYTWPLQCAAALWRKEEVLKHLKSMAVQGAESAARIGIRFTAYEWALREEEAPSNWSLVNAFGAGLFGGVASSGTLLRTNPMAVLSSGVTFGFGAMLYEALSMAQDLPTTAMKKRVNYMQQ
jgi:hypothetical protein